MHKCSVSCLTYAYSFLCFSQSDLSRHAQHKERGLDSAFAKCNWPEAGSLPPFKNTKMQLCGKTVARSHGAEYVSVAWCCMHVDGLESSSARCWLCLAIVSLRAQPFCCDQIGCLKYSACTPVTRNPSLLFASLPLWLVKMAPQCGGAKDNWPASGSHQIRPFPKPPPHPARQIWNLSPGLPPGQ